MFQLDKEKTSFVVRSEICGMDTDAQRGAGITIPGLVKIQPGKDCEQNDSCFEAITAVGGVSHQVTSTRPYITNFSAIP